MALTLVSESVLILVVCGVLTGALATFIALIVRSPGRSAAFPDFSVFVFYLDRDTPRIHLTIGQQAFEFAAQLERSNTLRVAIPQGMTETNLRDVIPKLSQGLSKLRYEYSFH